MKSERVEPTPGPWFIVPYGDGDSLVIHSDADNRVCFMATAGESGSLKRIAAAARLIAAAPDLLEEGEALIARLDAFEHCLLDDEPARRFFGHVLPVVARLRAAIAKARGL